MTMNPFVEKPNSTLGIFFSSIGHRSSKAIEAGAFLPTLQHLFSVGDRLDAAHLYEVSPGSVVIKLFGLFIYALVMLANISMLVDSRKHVLYKSKVRAYPNGAP